MSGNFRALNFSSADLGKDITLLLMFEPPKNGVLFKDLFPLIDKRLSEVLTFTSAGISAATVEYTADTGFLVPQVHSGNLVAASNAQRCQTGQTCTLMTKEDQSSNYLTEAVAGDPGALQCVNKAARPAEIGVGFFNKAGNKIEPTLMWKDIAVGSTLAAQLTPKLKIYAVSDYKATELIRGNIQSPLLFEENLIALPSFSEWTVSIDLATKQVVISKD
ncbi:hypothetical protein CVT25_004854 [Psilocybe cyanescens]|uniref:Uncharacterized protein n=1 Tax=Psilocybe cyanescens TaxID=93625 RepID=A0A409XMU5_PSICY|nr:hypothetical protein CVT25_004854 [Psilocybe cyanescens]